MNQDTAGGPSGEDALRRSITSLLAQAGSPPYMHNNMEAFQPGKTQIFYSGPFWGTEELAAALESLLRGQWLAAGEQVRAFETKFAKHLGQRQALMVNSGSSANLVLVAAMKRRHQWREGDEIVVSTVGFPTTVAPIVQCGLKPVFVDIEMETLNFDLDQVEAATGPRTKAIFLSPVLGNPPDMDRLVNFCRERGIHLLLDECDSLGTTWNGKSLGSMAAISSHSFYSSHHLCTGEGGMVVSDDPELIRIARSLAWWGRDCTCVGRANLLPEGSCGKRFGNWLQPHHDCVIDHRYIFTEIGYNLKPLDLQGAIGLVQLAKLPMIVERRRTARSRIGAAFERIPGLKIPRESSQAVTSWFGVPVLADSPALKNALVSHLEAAKIQTRHYFSGNLLQQPGYAHLGDWRQFPMASQVLDRVFFVGAAPHYNGAVFDYFDKTLAEFHG